MTKTFRTDGAFRVLCQSQPTNNASLTIEFDRTFEFKVAYPFRTPRFQLPANCSVATMKENASNILMPQAEVYSKDAHKPAAFLVACTIASTIFCFLTMLAYADIERTRRHFMVLFELFSGVVFCVFWLIACGAWFPALVQIKHRSNYLIYFLDICKDPAADCLQLRDYNWTPAYLSMVRGRFLPFLRFTMQILRNNDLGTAALACFCKASNNRGLNCFRTFRLQSSCGQPQFESDKSRKGVFLPA